MLFLLFDLFLRISVRIFNHAKNTIGGGGWSFSFFLFVLKISKGTTGTGLMKIPKILFKLALTGNYFSGRVLSGKGEHDGKYSRLRRNSFAP